MLFYTGTTRSADVILAEQNENLANGKCRRTLRRLVQLADELRRALMGNDLEAFGEILHESWMVKKTMANGVSSTGIDRDGTSARAPMAPPAARLRARAAVDSFSSTPRSNAIKRSPAPCQDLRQVAFGFEPQGSKIIYVEESDRE